MKRSPKLAEALNLKTARIWRRSHFLVAGILVYVLFLSFRLRRFFDIDSGTGGIDRLQFNSVYHETLSRKYRIDPAKDPPPKPINNRLPLHQRGSYGRLTGEILRRRIRRFTWSGNLTAIEAMARDAWDLGAKAWEEIENHNFNNRSLRVGEKEAESCPSSVSLNEKKLGVLLLPCGLQVGSSVTVIGVPEFAHREYVVGMVRRGRREGGSVQVSQFMVELQGLKAVDGEDPPKILHLNPRLKGDWSKRPVIEMNTCYRMQWGQSMRCEGLSSEDDGDGDSDKVDGYNKCEKWERSDTAELKESKPTSWLNRFIGRANKPEITWPFPFVEGKMFVLTIQAGMEGYHIFVGGHHVTSFPYRLGFTLEDATGLIAKGNVDVHSVYATSLPKSHPSFSVQNVLEMSEKWQSVPLPQAPVHLFIGILSATNHFAERMAVRKTWMQYPEIKSSYVFARFFVALGSRKEGNALLKKEAEYFGDIIILPFMDHYELVVLKTIAICEYGIQNVSAAYLMKCDDDTFVRLDVVLKEIDKFADNQSLYLGNLNLRHRPLRHGKWAVTYEEWPEEIYPPYANGPGYIISNDIARSIVSKHANESLRIFKMEDVSMGMWVEDFSVSHEVRYSHSWRFCQHGCVADYYTAHYQSPRQMICLWDKLASGHAQCCNFR